MALNPAALQVEIKNLLTDMETRTEDAKDEFASRLANAIHTYVSGAQVNAGIAVQVNTGTGTGATTAPGTLS